MPGRERVPSFQLPSGTTAERDGSYNLTTVGNIFYNTDTSNVEVYVPDSFGNKWCSIALNNRRVSTIAMISNVGSNDSRYIATHAASNLPRLFFGAQVYNAFGLYTQYVGYNSWITVVFDTGLDSSLYNQSLPGTSTYKPPRDGTGLIIPSSGDYKLNFSSSAGWGGAALGASGSSHGNNWIYWLRFLVNGEIAASTNSNISATNRTIHGINHQMIEFETTSIPLIKDDFVSVQIYHNRNSHTLLGTDNKARSGDTYTANASGNNAYNYEYIKKIVSTLTITKIS